MVLRTTGGGLGHNFEVIDPNSGTYVLGRNICSYLVGFVLVIAGFSFTIHWQNIGKIRYRSLAGGARHCPIPVEKDTKRLSPLCCL
jgi:hypothetical protein